MRLLLDAQLPKRLVHMLHAEGHDAVHTLDLPHGNHTSDAEIVRIADADARIVVTKDSDFVHTHVLYGKPAFLLLVATGNISNVALEKLILSDLPSIERAFDTSHFVEIGRYALISHK